MTTSCFLRRLALFGLFTAVLSACPGDDAGIGDGASSSSSTGDDDDDLGEDGLTTGGPTSSTGIDPDTGTSSTGPLDTSSSESSESSSSESSESSSSESSESSSSTESSESGSTETSSTTDTGGEAVCLETTPNCTAPADDCVCVGCNDDGTCGDDDDCVCTDCDGTDFCLPTDCNADGVCDPFFEGCACSDCYPHPECADNPQPCGNGAIEPIEDCDGDDLAGQDCVGLGFTEGTLSCSSACFFDTSACITTLGCNDDDACGEDDDCVCSDCDEAAFCGPFNCDFDGLCNPFTEGCACTDCYPHPECADNPQCGNGTIEGTEACEGDDLGGQDCVALGFTGGALACSDTCAFDTSACVVPVEWTCDPLLFADSVCDCGCGIVDADCTDATVEWCAFCNAEGSCAEDGGACPSDIDPVDNAHCV
jgi:hypothetical protein